MHGRTRLTFTVPTKAARRVIAPYVKIIRKHYQAPDVPESKLFNTHLERKPSVLLRDLTTFLTDIVDLPSLLHESSDVLKSTTQAHGVSLYLVDSATNEIYQSQRYFDIPEPRLRWKIEQGTIVAAYVASTKKAIMLDDLVLKEERFPMGIGQKDPLTKAVLCVPVVTADGQCQAVIELFKATSQGPFKEEDLAITTLVTGWMGSAIYQNLKRVTAHKKRELNEYLLDLTKVYLEEFVPMEKMLIEMVKFVNITLAAEKSALYLLDKEADEDELVADIYEKGGVDSDEVKKNYKVKLIEEENKLVVTVAKTGKTLNIKHAFIHPKLEMGVEEKTGEIIRSALCMAVKGGDDILGVIEVVNKKTSACFTPFDEILFDVYATYFAIVLQFNNCNRESRKQDKMKMIHVDLLKRQIGPCIHDYVHFMRNLNIKVPSTFLNFKWTIQDEFVDQIPLFCFEIFRDLYPPEQFDVPNLARFLLALRNMKGDSEYHNFEHAFDVFHCLYIILKRNDELFRPIEVKALLITVLCYCVGREGCISNEYLKMTNSDIYQLYPTYPWQHYHALIATKLYERYPFFNGLSKQEYKTLMKLIAENMILTNLQFFYYNHFEAVLGMKRRGILENPEVLKSLVITCCAMIGYAKDYQVGRKIMQSLRAEMYKEGLKIKQLKPDCILTKMHQSWDDEKVPEQQINLLDHIVLKTAGLLKEILPNTDEFYRNVLNFGKTWSEIVEMKGLKVWRPEESYS